MPLVGPVADKLGIDLIWFGVLLGVNMQTSFMHPPFGFALFYLRSVAPAKDYLDKITGKLTAKITTGQIYWGAVPFVIIQVIMVALVILFPQMVMVYKSGESTVDPEQDRDQHPAGRGHARVQSLWRAGPAADRGAETGKGRRRGAVAAGRVQGAARGRRLRAGNAEEVAGGAVRAAAAS